MKSRRKSDSLRAGLFLLVGVVVFTIAIFLLGEKSALFSRTTNLYVDLADISGITVGAPVRLAGLEIGTVAQLTFPDDLSRREMRVRMAVQSRYLERIRADSQAFIDSNGLLGDKVVNISMGSPHAPALQEGATLSAGRTVSFESLSTSANRALGAAANVTESVDRLVQDSRTAQLRDDLGRAAGSLARILAQIESGPGLAHELLYDPGTSAQFSAIVADTRSTVRDAKRAMRGVSAVLTEIERGDGTLHELVYGSDGKQLLVELGEAAAQIEELVREVREGSGLLHALVYDRGRADILDDLGQLASKLHAVVAAIDKGEGTLGALVRDPTVYEDLKSVLGNVQRNVLLKALVRFTIEEEQLRRAEEAPRVAPEAFADHPDGEDLDRPDGLRKDR